MVYLIITLVLSFILRRLGKKDENPVIEFKNVSKHFGQTQALHNIDLSITRG